MENLLYLFPLSIAVYFFLWGLQITIIGIVKPKEVGKLEMVIGSIMLCIGLLAGPSIFIHMLEGLF